MAQDLKPEFIGTKQDLYGDSRNLIANAMARMNSTPSSGHIGRVYRHARLAQSLVKTLAKSGRALASFRGLRRYAHSFLD